MQILLVKFSFFALNLGVSIETGTKRARCFANKYPYGNFSGNANAELYVLFRKDRQTIS